MSRFGVFGDIPTRAMFYVLRKFPNMPRFIEGGLLHFFSFVVLTFAHQQRKAISHNLSVIWTDSSFAERLVGAYRVFVNFGWTYIDGMRARLGQRVITWEIDGLENFEKLRSTAGSALIFTTHTGNYDLAGALFSPKFGRDLHTVRAPEKSEALQEIRSKELKEDTDRYQHFKVHYNTSESLLGIELARLLMEGELVAIQSDRVIADVSAIEIQLPDQSGKIRLPRGPMTLAAISKCPCHPLHVVRDSYRHYRIIFPDALDLSDFKRPREADFGRAWAASLMPFLYEHALEWFVFEEAFTK